MENRAKHLVRLLESISLISGKIVSWMTLLMVIITFVVVVLRYGFDLGWIWLQESIVYLHAWVFMLGAAYTLKVNGHVRVDVLYRAMSPRARARVDLFGSIFLLMPMSVFIVWISWEYVQSAWQVSEASPEAGGLPWVYILKTTLILMPVMLILQGIAQGIGLAETITIFAMQLQQKPPDRAGRVVAVTYQFRPGSVAVLFAILDKRDNQIAAMGQVYVHLQHGGAQFVGFGQP